MWDTFCIQKICIHFVYASFLIYKKCASLTLCIQFVYKIHTECIYTNTCMQNGSFISKYFEPFVVHFLVNHYKQLRLETCWLITGDIYQVIGLVIYILR